MPQITSAFVAGPELLRELEKRSKPVAVGPDRILFREGTEPVGVYIVLNGGAMLLRGSNGETVLTAEAGPGSLLGVPAVIGQKQYSLTAVATEDAKLNFMTCGEFVELMHKEPELSFQVLQVLAEEVRFARESMAHL
jgi:CRP-like cAMP-binding protein